MAYYDSQGNYVFGDEYSYDNQSPTDAGDGANTESNNNGGTTTTVEYNLSGEVVSTSSSPGGKVQGDPSHVYVGREWVGTDLFDVWQLYRAESGTVLEWRVKAGYDSRAIIWSTYRDIGPPSNMTVAQAPAGVYSRTPRKGDPSHWYVGTDYRGDGWQQYLASNGTVQQWFVAPGDDSRNIIAGSNVNLGPWSAATSVPASAVTGGGGVTRPPEPPPPPPTTQPQPPPVNNTGTTNNTGGYNGGANLPNPGRASFPSHFYVGRTTTGDFWQLFDGTNVIQWRVNFGDESGAKIPGTDENKGPWSAMTSVPKSYVDAWNLAHPKDVVVTTPPGGDVVTNEKLPASSAPLIIGIIGLVINALK